MKIRKLDDERNPKSARIVNIWNSLPNHDVNLNTVNLFKTRLDRFWAFSYSTQLNSMRYTDAGVRHLKVRIN